MNVAKLTKCFRALVACFVVLNAADPAVVYAADTESQRLAALVAASDEMDLQLVPQSGVQRGDLRYAGQYGDMITDDWIAANRLAAQRDMRGLLGIRRTALPPKEQMVYDVFRYQTQLRIRWFDLGLADLAAQMPLDQFQGQQLAFAQFSSGDGVAPFKTLSDYENGLKRIDGFVVYMDRCIARMQQGLAQSHVLSRVVTDLVIKQLDAVPATKVEDSDFYKPIRNFPDAISAEDRTRLTAAYRSAVTEKIYPAYARVRDFMSKDYLPGARTGAPGLSSLRDGDKLYAWNLEQFTTTKMRPAEIHALGLQEVARLTREMQAVKDQLGFKGTLHEFFDWAQEDAKFRFANGADLLSGYSALQRTIEPLLPRWFGKLPKARFEVKAIPSVQEATAGGAYYQPGTPDGVRTSSVAGSMTA